MSENNELDILEMPFEGLAAYWLSVKKFMDTKKGRAILKEETENTSEVFIKYLLETAFGNLSKRRVRRLAEAKRDTLLAVYKRRLDLMRVTLFALAKGEHPRKTLVRLDARFTHAPLPEKKAFDLANGLVEAVSAKGANLPELLNIDHRLKDDQLVVKLLYYAVRARAQGPQSLEILLPYNRSRFFSEGLALVIDNFESGFMDHHLGLIRNQVIAQTSRKMDMSIEMALAIREGLEYDDVFCVARAFMP